MKINSIILPCLACLAQAVLGTPSDCILKDNAPASAWDHGYGVGNGRLGALSYMDQGQTVIVLNEKSIFANSPIPDVPERASAFREVIKLCQEGKYDQATETYSQKVMDKWSFSGCFQPAGFVRIDFSKMGAPGKTNRKLDMRQGLVSEEYTTSTGGYTMQMLAAPTTDCIAILLQATGRDNLDISLSADRPETDSLKQEENDFVISGQASNGGTRFETRFRLIVPQGKREFRDGKIHVEQARQVLLLVSIATDYDMQNPTKPNHHNLVQENKKILDQAEKQGWSSMVRQTSQHFSTLLDRCIVDLGDSPRDVLELTTPERIKRFQLGETDPDLVELLFQFGRYCVISCSRPGTLPSTLQGIWNPDMTPPWESCFFLNINCQMNYWPVETTHLGEYHKPFTDFVISLLPGGQHFAKELGYEGFCFAHNTDCRLGSNFRFFDPGAAGTLLNGAWATSHLLEHYRYGGDKKELAKALPMLRENVRFILSWLEEEPGTGKLITGPGNSPEMGFSYKDKDGNNKSGSISTGTTHDLLLAREVMKNYEEACRELNVPSNDPIRDKVRQTLPRLAMPTINPDGRLAEWRNGQEETDKGHRHLSHCYGLFPGNEFDVLNTPDYAEAVRKSLDYRCANGSGHTGWSSSWIISLYAALRDGEHAEKFIDKLMKEKINPNLFDMHPPFQIDGNFGFTAGIANCLLQSQIVKDGKRAISVAPALVPSWETGSAQGMCTRGGLIVNLSWTRNKIMADIRATRNGTFLIEYKGALKPLTLKSGEKSSIEFSR